ncbi:MAG TPA: ATP-binding protein [Bacteroidales bacterium]|nr:ATP-binding protein [Bacteroidales bacterium]
MLIEMTFENFRSFKDRQTFSMLPINKYKELKGNIAQIEGNDLLKSAVIYGKNASGKSNILLAFKAISYMVSRSFEFKRDKPIPIYEPFLMDSSSAKANVFFEVLFFGKNKVKYKYSIEFNKTVVHREVLQYYPKGQPALIFDRNINEIKEGDPVKGELLSINKRLFDNQLLLSKASIENIDALNEPFLFFHRYLYAYTINSTCEACDKMIIDLHAATLYQKGKPHLLDAVNKLIRESDTGINEIYIKENKEEDFKFPETISEDRRKQIIESNKYQVFAKHNLYENEIIIGETQLDIEDESSGTTKIFAVGGLILDALSDGSVFLIDELDRSLHPHLSKIIVQLFNNPETNPKNAQLIFASHNTSLLSNDLFRRDQIWFTEKNDKGCSTFYTLGDLKGVRKDVPYEKYYHNGLFGGIPNLNLYNFFSQLQSNEEKITK